MASGMQDFKADVLAAWKVPGIVDDKKQFTPSVKERLTMMPFSGGTNPFKLVLLQDTNMLRCVCHVCAACMVWRRVSVPLVCA